MHRIRIDDSIIWIIDTIWSVYDWNKHARETRKWQLDKKEDEEEMYVCSSLGVVISSCSDMGMRMSMKGILDLVETIESWIFTLGNNLTKIHPVDFISQIFDNDLDTRLYGCFL